MVLDLGLCSPMVEVTGQPRPTRFLKCVRSDVLVSRGEKREARERER